MGLNESAVLGPYGALFITITFCTILLKDNKSLVRDVRSAFDKTVEMFSKELKACQESRDAMIARIAEMERRINRNE